MRIQFTCFNCGHTYDDETGNTDERMCNKCLHEHYEPTTTEAQTIVSKSVAKQY